MVDKLPDVWTPREYPVLREVARRIAAVDLALAVMDTTARARLTTEGVERAAEAFKRPRFVDHLGSWNGGAASFKDLSGEAYLATGLHPNGDEACHSSVGQRAGPPPRREVPAARTPRRCRRQYPRSVLSNVIAAVQLS